jgi:hypothetical protein
LIFGHGPRIPRHPAPHEPFPSRRGVPGPGDRIP